MERSLNLRGFNLASMARSRGGVQSESEQQANDSYLDGYNVYFLAGNERCEETCTNTIEHKWQTLQMRICLR